MHELPYLLMYYVIVVIPPLWQINWKWYWSACIIKCWILFLDVIFMFRCIKYIKLIIFLLLPSYCIHTITSDFSTENLISTYFMNEQRSPGIKVLKRSMPFKNCIESIYFCFYHIPWSLWVRSWIDFVKYFPIQFGDFLYNVFKVGLLFTIRRSNSLRIQCTYRNRNSVVSHL